MKLARLRLAAMVLAIAAVATSAMATGVEYSDLWNAPAIAWRDREAGLAEAKATGKPVVMVLHAQWCPNCRKYREVFASPDVVKASRDFVMVLIDIDSHADASAAYAPDGPYVPRTLFLDLDGNLEPRLARNGATYRHFLDYRGPGDLLALMSQAKALSRTTTAPAAPLAPSQAGQ